MWATGRVPLAGENAKGLERRDPVLDRRPELFRIKAAVPG